MESNNNDQNIQLVLRLFEGTLEKSNLKKYNEFFSEDCLVHAFQTVYNMSNIKSFDESLAKGFQLKKLIIGDIFSRADRVYVYWTFDIIHHGEYEGIVH